MPGVSVTLVLALVLVLAGVVPGTWSLHPSLSRWTRQAIHCQAGDEACKMCSTSCNTVEVSRLPECCEAYKTCCDQYFQACKKCSSVAAKDQYFPEYCCASFTDCCHLITTFQTAVKPAEPVRKEPKIELKVPSVAAPKPTSFPGLDSPSPAAPITPAASPFPTHSENAPQPPLALQPSAPTLGGSRGVVGSRRTQSGTGSQQRTRPAPQRPTSSGSRRRGRVSSRGRVLE